MKLLLLPLLSTVLFFNSAHAIDPANKVIKSLSCNATQSKAKDNDAAIASIALSGKRASPEESLTISYSEEFWATTGNGPQHRIISAESLKCSTNFYRSRASSYLKNAYYNVVCAGKDSDGNPVPVTLNVDSKSQRGSNIYLGYTGQTGTYPVQCTYETF